ncbi:MAG: IS1634 family transposase [Bacteroidetes bacterium]|nr:IS1634 family transposase [Bacteroidota bacterium]
MLDLNLPLFALLVNCGLVGLRRLWRLRRQAAWLVWGLWALVILSHLLGLTAGVGLVGLGTPLAASCSVLSPHLAVGWGGLGMAIGLWLAWEHGSAFPWANWQVRWTLRRRRLSDLTLEEWLALLPPGVGTLAQVVDWLTRSQTVKYLAALPLLYPILTELEVEAIIDKYCPTEAEVNIGAVIVCLCLNRLTAPHPLSGVSEWAARVTLEELVGVPASKLNDDRLGRALDAIQPHLADIWAEIVSRALVRYQIDLNLVFYDTTAFYFEGEYANSPHIQLGFCRSHRGKKQRKLALNVTSREKFPFLYQLLDGDVADVATVQANMTCLLAVLRERGWPVDTVLVVGDRAMISAEIVLTYHRANLKYLSALKVMGEPEVALIRSVSAAEFLAHPVDDDHASVEREYTFTYQGQSVTDRALVTLSQTLRRRQRHHRRAKIRERLATLQTIASQQLNRRKYKQAAYAWAQIEKQVLSQPGGEFLTVTLNGEEGDLQLTWQLNVAALRTAMRLDGKFILVTNERTRTPADLVACYGEKDKVEKANRTLKGPLRLRPVFLHNDQRIEALIFVTMLALLTYSILEMKCRRRGLHVTSEAILKGFAHLALIYTVCRDSSVVVRLTPLTRFQRQVVAALAVVTWPLNLAPGDLHPGGQTVVSNPLPDTQRLPLLI